MSRILLVGDVCLDVYHYGICSRLSPEAPVPIMDYKFSKEFTGMAFNVYRNLKAFDNTIDFVHGPFSKKERYIDIRTSHQLLRIDNKSYESEQVVFPADMFLRNYDAVVISDYDKGFVTEELICQIKERWQNKPIFVDTKKKNLELYRGCIVKINELEYNESTGHEFPKELIVTLGADGAKRADKHYEAPSVSVHDVTGAGDVFLSVMSSVYLDTEDMDYAIQCAIKLSTESVKHFGSYTLTQKDIHEHIDYW